MPKYRDGAAAFLYRQIFNSMPPLPAVNLEGKTFVITGANAGIGCAFTKQVVSLNGRAIMAVRTLDKGLEARREILQQHPTAEIEVRQCDLDSWDSVQTFAKGLAQSEKSIHAVVLNAALFPRKWLTSPAGYERSIQANVLSNALLALLLLPLLTHSPPGSEVPRIVMVSSEVHAFTPFKERSAEKLLPVFSDPAKFDPNDRYYSSKLLNLLWTLQLAKKVDSDKVKIVLILLGYCVSGLFWEMEGAATRVLAKLMARTADEGARMLSYAAFGAPDHEVHGSYYSQGKRVPTSTFTTSSEGLKMQEKVWEEVNDVIRPYLTGVPAPV